MHEFIYSSVLLLGFILQIAVDENKLEFILQIAIDENKWRLSHSSVITSSHLSNNGDAETLFPYDTKINKIFTIIVIMANFFFIR